MFNPDTWSDISVVGIIVMIALGTAFSLIRGWIILGPHHREVLAAKDDDLNESRRREAVKDDTIAIQARTISENNTNNQIMDHVLKAIREAIETGRGGGES